ncbi:hypothetical protein J4Q44_G00065490, partial [Coregonus suidteri]
KGVSAPLSVSPSLHIVFFKKKKIFLRFLGSAVDEHQLVFRETVFCVGALHAHRQTEGDRQTTTLTGGRNGKCCAPAVAAVILPRNS